MNRDGSSKPAEPQDQRAWQAPDFRRLFESAPGLYLVLTPDFTIVAASDGYLAVTMTRREDVLGRSIFDVFPDNPDDLAATGVRNLTASLERVRTELTSDSMAVQKYDIRRHESEGGGFEERYWSPCNVPVLDDQGELVYIIHRVEDVTEFVRLKQQGAEQQQLTELLRTRGEQMEAEIYQRAKEIQLANERLREAKAELESRVQARTRELAEANEALQAEIRQSQRLEEQFRHAQKMEAVGLLAGGVAHDFNNLLTVIVGYSDLLLNQLLEGDSLRNSIKEIKRAGDRGATLTRQLLAFSRQQILEPKVLDLNGVVRESDRLLRRLIGEDILLSLELEPNLWPIKADLGQLEQVIMNLAVNARDAMPTGGGLRIETSNVELDQSYALTHPEIRVGPYVLMTVGDTGCGMDAATQTRIFEPFFTTKGHGKGSGLGLATVFGIVKQSGGHVWVYSELGHGTIFKVYLPRAESPATSEPSPAAPARPTPTGTETILLVEDDEAVRGIAVLVLTNSHYTVLQAGTPQEAIRICESHPGPIHLLISDVIMPEMGGRQVADAILALRPNIKVLYMSGYTDDAVVRHGISHEQVAFLQKPFSPNALAGKVRQVLSQ